MATWWSKTTMPPPTAAHRQTESQRPGPRFERRRPATSIGLAVSDEELVLRMLSGDRWAKEAFYRKHVERAYRVAFRLVRHRADAEDCVQEAFSQAFCALPKLREPSSVRAWFLRIVVNRAHRRFRRRRALQFFGAAVEEASDVLVQSSSSAEVHSELALVEQALGRTSAVDRAAWILRRVEGCSLSEVAAACSASLATVKRRIARADQTIERHVRANEPSSSGLSLGKQGELSP